MSWRVSKTDQEWRDLLTPSAYRVLRKKATEPAGAGGFNKFFPKVGHFACGGCNLPLYSADSKFNDCGWIAFDKCYHNSARSAFGTLQTPVNRPGRSSTRG